MSLSKRKCTDFSFMTYCNICPRMSCLCNLQIKNSANLNRYIDISHVAIPVHVRDERWLLVVQEIISFINLFIYALVVVVSSMSGHVWHQNNSLEFMLGHGAILDYKNMWFTLFPQLRTIATALLGSVCFV